MSILPAFHPVLHPDATPPDREAAVPRDVSSLPEGSNFLPTMLSCPATMSVLGIVFGCFFACGLIVAGWGPAAKFPELATFISAAFFLVGGNLLGRLLRAVWHPA